MKRRRWVVAPVAAVAILALILVIRTTGDRRESGAHLDTGPVLVGSVALNTTRPSPGAPVVAAISIAADRPLRLDALVLAVRDEQGHDADPAGRHYDFPDAGPISLGTEMQTVTMAHQFRHRGTYVYFLRYRRGRHWQVLPPYSTFTVG
jgi:hypothetical protein